MALSLAGSSVSLTGAIVALTLGWLAWQLVKVLYNLSPFHPLSKIPGPRLAAATYWPEFYHDVILGGRYTHAIKAMHDQYGPIVRINPRETHCNDIAFTDEIYAVSRRKRDKPWHQINGSTVGTGNIFGAHDHDLHKLRRAPIARFFSYGMIQQLEGDIKVLLNKLCDKLLAEKGRPFDVATAYSCFTTDAISGYCFGEPFGLLNQKSWQPNFREPTMALLKPVFVFRFFPFLVTLTKPAEWFIDYFPEDTALLLRTLKVTIPSFVHKTKAELDAGITHARTTIFGSLLTSELAGAERDPSRLADEAVTVVSAGTETTAWALAVITFHLLDKPQLLKKLRAELTAAVPDPRALPSWTEIEKLPFLGATIHEGLRLSYGVSSRLPLEPAQEDLVYHGEWKKRPVEYTLPRGYAIGMSPALVHHDEGLFPESNEFSPARWLEADGRVRRRELEKGLLAFSKGSRACLGKNLALCELYLSVTALALRVWPHMRLYETTVEDTMYDHDMMIPMVRDGSKGVRVIVG